MKTALVCIAHGEENYIHEWMSYNKKIGFDHIFIFENDWISNINDENVTTIPWNGRGMQMLAYNHFIRNLSQGYDWAAIFDVDEFLVLNKHHNLKDFLMEYEECNAIGINWAIFGCNGHIQPIDNNYKVLERFTKRAPESFEANKHIKTIVKLPSNRYQHGHCVDGEWYNLNKEKRTGSFNSPVDYSIAQLNHYFTKSHHEFRGKCLRRNADHSRRRKFKHYWPYINANDIEDTKALDFFLG